MFVHCELHLCIIRRLATQEEVSSSYEGMIGDHSQQIKVSTCLVKTSLDSNTDLPHVWHCPPNVMTDE